jgi:hypothetical protein
MGERKRCWRPGRISGNCRAVRGYLIRLPGEVARQPRLSEEMRPEILRSKARMRPRSLRSEDESRGRPGRHLSRDGGHQVGQDECPERHEDDLQCRHGGQRNGLDGAGE